MKLASSWAGIRLVLENLDWPALRNQEVTLSRLIGGKARHGGCLIAERRLNSEDWGCGK